MATETASSGLSDHVRGVTITTIACLSGIAAGVVSASVVGTDPASASDTLAVVIMAAFIFVQYPILKVIGVDLSEFGIKDNLFVSFMTFTLWFVTYTVLLTSGVQL
ncbi:MAG: hypothetical protein ACQETB_00300 [Halobacteriota archaeon]